MPRKKQTPLEYRKYNLPTAFPVLFLSGDDWKISDIPSGILHFHNCLEIGFCESEHGMITFGKNTYPFHEGDITIISSDIPHTTYSASGCASKWAYLYLHPEELLFSKTPSISIPTPLSFMQHTAHILSKHSYPDIYFLVQQIIREMSEQKEHYEFAVKGLFISLFVLLERLESNPKAQTYLHDSETTVSISPALRAIKYQYMQELSVPHLASLCGLSETHFRRLFLSIMGVSPLAFINLTRIEKASERLSLSEDSILCIAEQVGFSSLSSFNRHFLTIMGESPRDWRKRMATVTNPSISTFQGWMKAETFPHL